MGSQEVVDAQDDLAVAGRPLLNALIESSRLYRSTKNYRELLDFVTRLPNFAPFNGMLLQIRWSGLQFAASENDWLGL
jgi:hypothetical protein